MKFTNDPGAITRLLETADQIGGILVVESEFPGRQPDLPVLMRIKPRYLIGVREQDIKRLRQLQKQQVVEVLKCTTI